MSERLTYEQLERKVRELDNVASQVRRENHGLKDCEEKYSALFDNANDAIFIVDAKTGIIADANKEAERLLGRSRRDIIGMHQSLLHPADEVQYYRNKFNAHVQSERVTDFEAEIVKADGRTVPVYISGAAVELQGRKVIQGIFKDISEPRRAVEELRQSEDKYRTLVEHLPQKIFHKGADSVYVSCNESYARDLKIKPEEIKGKTDYDFFPKKLAEKYRADDKEVIASGQRKDIEEVYVQDGQEVFVQTVKTPIRNEKGYITGVLGIFWDITKRRRAEDALREREAVLQAQAEELGELNSALRVLLKRREADRIEFEKRMFSSLRQMVIPHLKKLKSSGLDAKQRAHVDVLESSLQNIIAPLSPKLLSKFLNLTSREIQVANLVREGKTTKTIAELLNVSQNAVVFHRYRIREKLGLKKRKINLGAYLSSLR
jgi:PAS domain S-box-containing protein